MPSQRVAENPLLLQNIDRAGLPDLFDHKKHIVYPAGGSAFSSSDTLKNVYFILSGKIKISQVNPETSKEQTLYLLSRGDIYDVITLLDGREHDYISVALEESEVVEVPIGHIRELIENDPAFNTFFFPYLAKQMRNMEELAVDLSLYDVYNRLLRLIARNVDTAKGRSLKLINNLSHEELAALVGSVRKVVNRNIQKLKKEGVLEVSRKQLKLKSLQQLFEKLKY